MTPFAQSRDLPPDFSLTELPGTGHMLMLEAPDVALAAVRRALAGAETMSAETG